MCGFPHLPPNLSHSKRSSNVIVLQPKHVSTRMEAKVHTALKKALPSRSVVLQRALRAEGKWRNSWTPAFPSVRARSFSLLKWKFFNWLDTMFFLVCGCRALGKLEVLTLGRQDYFESEALGKGEAQRNAAGRELGLRMYTLEGTLANDICNSVKLGA